jgi:LemA protein
MLSLPILILLAVVFLGLWVVLMFNGLVTAKTRVEEAQSDVEVQLKRRYDLIPNLLSSVKGYAKHEEGVFTKVTEARAQAMSADKAHKAEAEQALSASVRSLMLVAEAYPELKASDNFRHLQSELVDAEDKIQAARRFYNAGVRDFNTKLQVFPTNLLANALGFRAFSFYDAPEESEALPKVEF